jgi:hypothetical protein
MYPEEKAGMKDRLEVPKFAGPCGAGCQPAADCQSAFRLRARSQPQMREPFAAILHRALETETPNHGVDRQ